MVSLEIERPLTHTRPLPAALESQPEAPGISLIQADHLTVTYRDEPALDNVSFTIRERDKVAIIGPNGAGKSTLMKLIMGELQPQSGTLQLHPGTILGYVPQHEGVDWNFPVTVRDVVMMGRYRHLPWHGRPGVHQYQVVASALERVGMTAFARRGIGELSGGQRRRVFMARALAQQATILLLDEPFSGVDASAQASMMDVLDSLHAEGLTIILSTHDLGLAFNRFDQMMSLRKRLIAFGRPHEIDTQSMLQELYGQQLTPWGKVDLPFLIDDHHCGDC
jgi:ABC-type Mn2+/Zn2+ transport system ATPase subunit